MASKLNAAHGVGLSAPVAGAVAGLLALLILVAALATGGRAGRLARGIGRVAVAAAEVPDRVRGLVQGQFADLGFRVDAVRLQGASAASRDLILRAAAIPSGAPILGLDLAAVRARVERVGWVEHARVIRLLPDRVLIAIAERPLMAVWQTRGRLAVVAADGQIAPGADPGQYPLLPRIIGEGANTEAASLLREIAKHPTLAARQGWLRRVDRRRWDLILKDGGVILLPETGEAAALDRLDGLDRAGRALSLGFERIDLRDPAFIVVRPRGAAPTSGSHGV